MKYLLALSMVCASGAVYAQGAPATVSFAARLADGNLPIAGNHDFIFRLYDSPSSQTPLWTETQLGVVVPSDGVLLTDLGAVTPLQSSFFDGTTRYLEITLDNLVYAPRIPIESVPYAFSSSVSLKANNSDNFGGNPPAFYQRAAGAPCAVGFYVQGIAADGTLTCMPDLNTTYTAGNGIAIAGTTIAIDTTKTQARVTGMCATGAISTIAADGSVTCLTAGTGLAFATGTFAVDFTTTQARVPGCATANAMINTIAQNGAATCITAGTGLAVATNTMTVDTNTIQARVSGTCATGAITAIAANGTVTCSSPSAAMTVVQLNNFASAPPNGQFLIPYSSSATATEGAAWIIAPFNGSVSNLFLELSGNPGAGNSNTVTIRINASNSTVTCTASNNTSTCSDTTHTATFTQGQHISIQWSIGGGSNKFPLALSFALTSQ